MLGVRQDVLGLVAPKKYSGSHFAKQNSLLDGCCLTFDLSLLQAITVFCPPLRYPLGWLFGVAVVDRIDVGGSDVMSCLASYNRFGTSEVR